MAKNHKTEMIEKARQEISRAVFGSPDSRDYLEKHLSVARPILAELAELGYNVDTLDDLRHQGRPWKAALPVLLRWLPMIDEPSVKESIIRCLSVPWAGNKATPELIEEFRKYAPVLPKPSNPWVGHQLREIPDEEKKAAAAFSLGWTIGNALSIVDVKGFESQIIELCRNPRYGMARQMVVLGLGRLGSSAAEETAVELLNDEGVQLHAISALGRMKSKRALFELEKLLADKRAAIRKEARKAITRIMREHM